MPKMSTKCRASKPEENPTYGEQPESKEKGEHSGIFP